MRPDLPDTVRRLAALLRDENAALAATDFARAGALLPAKHAAADALVVALRDAAAPAVPDAEMRELVMLAEENRRLLNRALRIQRRILDVVAKAARRGDAAPLYRTSGRAESVPSAPRSLLTRV